MTDEARHFRQMMARVADDKEDVQWLLMRQDDNGNQFEVSRLDTRTEAEALRAKYEARAHKQTYWIEKAKDLRRRHKTEPAQGTSPDLSEPYVPTPEPEPQDHHAIHARRRQLQHQMWQLHEDLSALYFEGARAFVVEDTDDGPRLRAADQ